MVFKYEQHQFGEFVTVLNLILLILNNTCHANDELYALLLQYDNVVLYCTRVFAVH